jgi:hypothetical protein
MKCKCCKCYKKIAEDEQVKSSHSVYCQLPIFNKERANTEDKDPFWANFKKAQTKTYKCRDCEKVLISRQRLDFDFFWVGELGCDKCGSSEKGNKHICSICYLKRLEAGDPIIKADFFKYHYSK